MLDKKLRQLIAILQNLYTVKSEQLISLSNHTMSRGSNESSQLCLHLNKDAPHRVHI